MKVAAYLKTVLFLFPVGVCIDASLMIGSYVLCMSTHFYTLETEENVDYVRVCACCNHYPFT